MLVWGLQEDFLAYMTSHGSTCCANPCDFSTGWSREPNQEEICGAFMSVLGATCTSKWSELCPGVDHPEGAQYNDSPLSDTQCSQCHSTVDNICGFLTYYPNGDYYDGGDCIEGSNCKCEGTNDYCTAPENDCDALVGVRTALPRLAQPHRQWVLKPELTNLRARVGPPGRLSRLSGVYDVL